MMKASMKMAMRDFCAQCMVRRYEDTFYVEASKHYRDLMKNSAEAAKGLYRQRERLRKRWKDIRVQPPEREETGPFRVGNTLKVSTVVELGELRPDEVDVELYYGSMKSVDSLTASQTKMMDVQEERGNGFYRYTCSVTCDTAGRFGFTARVTPRGDQRIKFIPGLLTWASS